MVDVLAKNMVDSDWYVCHAPTYKLFNGIKIIGFNSGLSRAKRCKAVAKSTIRY